MSANMSKVNFACFASALALAFVAGCSSKAQDGDAAGSGEGGATRLPDSSAVDARSPAAQDPDVPSSIDQSPSQDSAGTETAQVDATSSIPPAQTDGATEAAQISGSDLGEPDIRDPVAAGTDVAASPAVDALDVAWPAERTITVDSQQGPDVTSASPAVTSIGVTPLTGTSCTARQLTVNVVGGEGTVTATWDFADGTVGTGLTVSHRFLTPGTRDVTVSVTDSVGRRATSTVSVAIAPVSRDVHLRFQIKASDPDALDFIRSVDLDATPIGVPGLVRMRDDGIAGGDVVAGDGIYGAEAFVASCEDLQTPVQIKVQDATGVIKTISSVPARYANREP
jgi:hypothetical protein